MKNDLKSLALKFYKRKLEGSTLTIQSTFIVKALNSSASLWNGTSQSSLRKLFFSLVSAYYIVVFSPAQSSCGISRCGICAVMQCYSAKKQYLFLFESLAQQQSGEGILLPSNENAGLYDLRFFFHNFFGF